MALRDVVTLDSGHGPAARNLARALSAPPRYDEALQHAQRAVGIQPQDAGSRYVLAHVVERPGPNRRGPERMAARAAARFRGDAEIQSITESLPTSRLCGMSNSSPPNRQYNRRDQTDERSTGAGRHPQGRVRPDVGRQARTVGRQRSPFRRLGDLPREGIARGPESAVCVAVERLVRPDHPALERRRQDAGSRSATSSCTTASPARTSGTTARRTPGSSSASGTSSRR